MDSVKGENPVLGVVSASLDCSIWAEHDFGDHLIILGRVPELGASENSVPDPLFYPFGKDHHRGAHPAAGTAFFASCSVSPHNHDPRQACRGSEKESL
ncbi:flavin reductase family protein [Arthrobacter sp. PGP41]|uniref:flavin reductase family protein n=1 Tax=Arthrobacter sp. PGP41 TaxID=2079227 RepID=UPI001319CB1D